MKTIEFNNKHYPEFQTNGNAARFCMPFAKEVCFGKGYDIGCMKKEWALPGAIPIDLSFEDEWEALNLPEDKVDYIFSSHCLEHISDWVNVLNYWDSKLSPQGLIFLYLPDYSQEYWRPWNNRKHVNILTPVYLEDYFKHKGYSKIFVTGVDLYNAFTVVAQK